MSEEYIVPKHEPVGVPQLRKLKELQGALDKVLDQATYFKIVAIYSEFIDKLLEEGEKTK